MTYQLHDNIPAPDARRAGRPGAGSKYPFAEMALNQSFYESTPGTAEKSQADVQREAIDRIRGAATRWRKTSGQKSVQFRVDVYADAEGRPYVGCWRVA